MLQLHQDDSKSQNVELPITSASPIMSALPKNTETNNSLPLNALPIGETNLEKGLSKVDIEHPSTEEEGRSESFSDLITCFGTKLEDFTEEQSKELQLWMSSHNSEFENLIYLVDFLDFSVPERIIVNCLTEFLKSATPDAIRQRFQQQDDLTEREKTEIAQAGLYKLLVQE